MSTLKVDTILKRTGTGTISIGQSGDTVALPSATLTTALPVTSGGIGGTSFSAAGLANTPGFAAYLNSSTQNVVSQTWTKVNMYGEDMDTSGAYDTSNARFTIPSGQAGKYMFGAVGRVNNSHTITLYMYIYKNGNSWLECGKRDSHGSGTNLSSIYNQGVIDAAAGDYFEVYIYNDGDTTGFRGSSSATSARESWWFGYKLIGA